MKLPPASEKDVFAVAFIVVREPFEITIPGLDVLPRISRRLLPPKAKFALPLIDRFSPAATYRSVREFAVKLPPARLKAVLAVAFIVVREPFEITILGLDVLPRISRRLLPPKAKFALPLIDRFSPAATYRSVREFAVKLPPARLKAVLAVAFIVVREPFEITIPGLDVLPRVSRKLLPPNAKFALPLIDIFGPAATYLTVREFAVKFPPARLKDVLAVAFMVFRKPFEITMPGLDVLPRVRRRLLLPNAKFAVPLIDRFSPAATYRTVSEFDVKSQPARLKAVLAVAFIVVREPFEITIPGLDVLPRIKSRLLSPNAKLALPLIERF